MNWVMTVAIFCLLIRLTFDQDSAVKPIISVMPSVCHYICLVICSSLLLHWLCVGSLEYSWLRKITFMANEDQKKPFGMILLSAAPYGGPKAVNMSCIAK